ncbi:undecaprenyl phosphate translocase family protein [Haladaptatus sp. GCM10025893]|uniref:undecaprenyl phosphate translocase family protein n=1 Tax=Haladaptatus sp. GCM10025893 TaxID=3252659 RepID=UPI003623D5F7
MVSDSPNTETRTLTESSQTSPEWRRTYAIGLCMGIADALPGVSGGTVALIAGIYERLITAISSLSLTHFHTLLQPHTQREGFSTEFVRSLTRWMPASSSCSVRGWPPPSSW